MKKQKLGKRSIRDVLVVYEGGRCSLASIMYTECTRKVDSAVRTLGINLQTASMKNSLNHTNLWIHQMGKLRKTGKSFTLCGLCYLRSAADVLRFSWSMGFNVPSRYGGWYRSRSGGLRNNSDQLLFFNLQLAQVSLLVQPNLRSIASTAGNENPQPCAHRQTPKPLIHGGGWRMEKSIIILSEKGGSNWENFAS